MEMRLHAVLVRFLHSEEDISNVITKVLKNRAMGTD
jgi:hypothetical protein